MFQGHLCGGPFHLVRGLRTPAEAMVTVVGCLMQLCDGAILFDGKEGRTWGQLGRGATGPTALSSQGVWVRGEVPGFALAVERGAWHHPLDCR
jgi:hypothetical protein